ncbi:MAG: hypothetical protein V4490_06250, partial [Pseudomonadota bacterium]
DQKNALEDIANTVLSLKHQFGVQHMVVNIATFSPETHDCDWLKKMGYIPVAALPCAELKQGLIVHQLRFMR